MSALLQSAAHDAIGKSPAQSSGLEKYVTLEPIRIKGAARYYAPFLAHVTMTKMKSGHHYTEDLLIAGVAGIVEGPDQQLTKEIATSVEKLLPLCGISLTNGLPDDLADRNKQCLKKALKEVVAQDFERLEKVKGTGMNVVWFIKTQQDKSFTEFGEKNRFYAPLRTTIFPAAIKKQLAEIDPVFELSHSSYTCDAQLEKIKEYAEYAQTKEEETHEALVMKFNPDFYHQFSSK
jgi:hypothetical protein